jgi:hypothetical protein
MENYTVLLSGIIGAYNTALEKLRRDITAQIVERVNQTLAMAKFDSSQLENIEYRAVMLGFETLKLGKEYTSMPEDDEWLETRLLGATSSGLAILDDGDGGGYTVVDYDTVPLNLLIQVLEDIS